MHAVRTGRPLLMPRVLGDHSSLSRRISPISPPSPLYHRSRSTRRRRPAVPRARSAASFSRSRPTATPPSPAATPTAAPPPRRAPKSSEADLTSSSVKKLAGPTRSRRRSPREAGSGGSRTCSATCCARPTSSRGPWPRLAPRAASPHSSPSQARRSSACTCAMETRAQPRRWSGLAARARRSRSTSVPRAASWRHGAVPGPLWCTWPPTARRWCARRRRIATSPSSTCAPSAGTTRAPAASPCSGTGAHLASSSPLYLPLSISPSLSPL